jgi:hypothetical protein
MSKRGAVIDMGKHKPVQSSWRSMDTLAYSRSYEPETRQEFHCYVTGQAKAMADEYQKKLDAKAWQNVLDMLGNA